MSVDSHEAFFLKAEISAVRIIEMNNTNGVICANRARHLTSYQSCEEILSSPYLGK